MQEEIENLSCKNVQVLQDTLARSFLLGVAFNKHSRVIAIEKLFKFMNYPIIGFFEVLKFRNWLIFSFS